MNEISIVDQSEDEELKQEVEVLDEVIGTQESPSAKKTMIQGSSKWLTIGQSSSSNKPGLVQGVPSGQKSMNSTVSFDRASEQSMVWSSSKVFKTGGESFKMQEQRAVRVNSTPSKTVNSLQNA